MRPLLYAIVFQLATVARSSVIQDMGVASARVGTSVTLKCYYNNTQVASHYSWYRQTLGGRPVVLSTIYKFDTPSKMLVWLEKHPRFAVQRQEGQNHLHISNVQPEDMALYFCGSSHNNIVEFGQGIFLNVQGPTEPISKHVTQEPALASAVAGSSVTLNCSVRAGACAEDHSVYWLKQGSGLGLLHTHGPRCKPQGPQSGAQSCTYHLQKPGVSRADAGKYYCAVASCGEVLFGNGTVLQVSGEDGDLKVHIVVLMWLSIARMGVLLLMVTVCLFMYCIRSRQTGM
ncbi:uncharacterized protein LOC110174940 [Boleophthalmus pectinirostris]|uniref:uncharacterized protein LOC110174940 n=1 Tax=Boleophthalmus pectinirostris TaxID=150288 RepID=UPI000A1C22D4|nr:uncharacterized protein LOC110174940 [Boleophthalmus pectinirostris]